jgi:hypothetical protein
MSPNLPKIYMCEAVYLRMGKNLKSEKFIEILPLTIQLLVAYTPDL